MVVLKKNPSLSQMDFVFAEAEGFEPPVPCGTPVFKTGTFDHSVTPPELRDKNTLSDSNTLIKLQPLLNDNRYYVK